MRDPFHLVDGVLWWDDKVVGDERGLSFAAGDKVGEYAREGDGTYNLAPLPGGDILFMVRGDVVGVERKSWADLVNSRYNGRLADQMRRMLKTFDRVVLCVEAETFVRRAGSSPRVRRAPWKKQSPVMWDDVMTMLLDWQTAGVLLVFTNGPGHTVSYVRKLVEKWRTGRSKELTRLPTTITTGAEGLESLVCVPGIGPKLARKMVDVHGDLKTVWKRYGTWTEARLAAKDGKGTARKMLRWIGR